MRFKYWKWSIMWTVLIADKWFLWVLKINYKICRKLYNDIHNSAYKFKLNHTMDGILKLKKVYSV